MDPDAPSRIRVTYRRVFGGLGASTRRMVSLTFAEAVRLCSVILHGDDAPSKLPAPQCTGNH